MMSSILVKIFATALTLAQVTTQPDAVRTKFDPVRDQAEVTRILKDGCAHMVRAFDIETINIDDLIATALEDPQAVTGDVKALQGINLAELHVAYKQFCKNEDVPNSPVNLAEVIEYYNGAVADLPDHAKLKGLRLPGVSAVLDAKGQRFAEVYEPDNRRVWVPLDDVPLHVRQAFVAAEDKRFFEHRGVDERGVIRAFMGNLAQPGRPQGGSTITQQVAKNLLVGDDVTYERKMREMIVASRIERTLSKSEILEIYLNAVYLGRTSWGIEMAARSYFGKPTRALTLAEGALLAALTKGPNYYNPDRQPERAHERMAYVLSRMQEDGAITAEQMQKALAQKPALVAFQLPRQPGGFHFIDHLKQDARAVAGFPSLTAQSITVRSTILPELQLAAEASLQEGLARYELSTGRFQFQGAEANLSAAIKRIETEQGIGAVPAWQQALAAARLPLYDVHWPAAVIVAKSKEPKTGAETIRVGLADGRVVPLATWNASIRKQLKLHDVVFVRVVETAKQGARAELRVRPSVQGAALVLENKTGRILAMAGGFSYPLSQLNRVTQAERQPGSTLKPLAYLAALGQGLQPNTLIWDAPVTLPPVGGATHARARDYWSPKNYDGGSGGLVTLRRALENSKNLVTARLLDGAITSSPERSLKLLCDMAKQAQIYNECVRHYPFILGAQPVRLIDLAAFYAAIANEGFRPQPYAIEAVEQGGRVLYRRPSIELKPLESADRVAFFQLKTILQGVLERGTARQLKSLSRYVAGKTGTTDGENDAWFVGFTNDVTVAVWVGYDNADKRKTLGRGATGAKVAIPIFEPIIQAAWEHHAPKTELAPPSKEAERFLMAMPIDLRTGDRVTDGEGGFKEYFRLTRFGMLDETQFRLVPRDEAEIARYPGQVIEEGPDGWGSPRYNRSEPPVAQIPFWRDLQRSIEPLFRPPYWEEEAPRRRPRRVDPDYFWGERIY